MKTPALILFAALSLRGQSVAFEVATVKLSGPQSKTLGFYTFPGGRVTAENRTLQDLLEEALGLQSFQILGGPNWVREVRYDIDARPPVSSKSSKLNPPDNKRPPNDEQRQMLEVLLIERFQLKFHRETREGPVYLLTKGKKELKLAPSKDKDAFPWVGNPGGGGMIGGGIAGINISMAVVAARLAPYLGRPVLDQTEIEGSFDFKFEYRTDDARPDVITSIITSLQGLGLKLESSKGPIEMIVIDHAEKPAAN
jgi:uncharacterized protein (TIGR03435 family)